MTPGEGRKQRRGEASGEKGAKRRKRKKENQKKKARKKGLCVPWRPSLGAHPLAPAPWPLFLFSCFALSLTFFPDFFFLNLFFLFSFLCFLRRERPERGKAPEEEGGHRIGRAQGERPPEREGQGPGEKGSQKKKKKK